MASSVADLFVVLDSVTDPFSRGMKAAAADAEAQSHRMSSALGTVVKAGLGIGAAAVGVGVASVKMATDFQAKMTLLSTQAGVAKNQIGFLSDGVLNLAGQVGFAPNSLADALFHIESSFASTGITGQHALDLLKVAAEGAAVGHADLVDVTNALDAAVVSGIPGVQNLSEAMGQLNATVGAGDMTMQDLANAFSTGLLANVKSYGITFRDVSAALAVFGDNNMRGQVAATDFRMAVQAMAKPASTASVELAKMGLSSDSLAKTMSAGGLLPALQLLHERMVKIGVTEKDQGAVLTDLFGKKAGAGIVVLYDQLTRLESKYTEGAKSFDDAWAETKNTFSQQVKDIGAGMDALGIRIGLWLIPQVSKLITTVQGAGGGIMSGFTGAATKPLGHDNMHNAFLNQDLAAPPPLTGWQRFGEEIRRVLGDIEDGAKRLEPVGQEFVQFGEDTWHALEKIAHAAEPVAHDLGVGVFLGAEAAGKVLSDVLAPPIRWIGDFIDAHQTMFRVFADVVLGGIALKMGALGAINAGRGLVDLATKIVQFPVAQVGEITSAWDGMKAAWTGKEAAEGEQAVQGLSGAFQDLKAKASGVLDKILPDSGKLAGIAQMGQDFDQASLKAKGAADQLSLFETTEKGVVQVAGQEQLALFASDLSNVEVEAGKAATTTEAAGVASAGMGAKMLTALGPIALIGGALVGLGYAAQKTGMTADDTGRSADNMLNQLGASTGMAQDAINKFGQLGAKMVEISNQPAGGPGGMQEIDKTLTDMVTSGHLDWAKARFDAIATSLKNDGMNSTDAASKFPAYEKALKDAGNAAQTMDGKIQDSLNAMQRQSGLNQFGADLGNLQQQLKDSGNALLGNSTAAGANQQAFQSLAQEMSSFYQSERNSGVGAYQATADYQNQYVALESLATATLGSKDAADKFLGTLNLIKPNYDTTINLNVGQAYQALNGLLQTIGNSVGTVQITGTGGGLYGGGKAYGDGGWVPGAAGAPQVAVVHGGEYVVSEAMQAGRAAIDPRILSGSGLRGSGSVGYVPGFAQGGTTVVNNFHVHIAGSLLTEDQALAKLRTLQLQWSRQNGGTGWSVP